MKTLRFDRCAPFFSVIEQAVFRSLLKWKLDANNAYGVDCGKYFFYEIKEKQLTVFVKVGKKYEKKIYNNISPISYNDTSVWMDFDDDIVNKKRKLEMDDEEDEFLIKKKKNIVKPKKNNIFQKERQMCERPMYRLEDWKFGDPAFLSPKFVLEYSDSRHLLIVELDQISENNTFCKKCGVNDEAKCLSCRPLYKFNENFILKTDKFMFLIPSYGLMGQKNITMLRYLIAWLKAMSKYAIDKKIKNDQELTREETEKIIALEYMKYKNFMCQDFLGGNLKVQQSGKKSFIRNNILASKLTSFRQVLIIDCQLGPGEVSISKNIYDKLENIKNPYILLNRDPSINDFCVSVSKLLYHEDDDMVIKISAFVADGLHADVDGDAINCFIWKGSLFVYNGLIADLAVKELQENHWELGSRINNLNEPRYSFGQYYVYIIYKYLSLSKK